MYALLHDFVYLTKKKKSDCRTNKKDGKKTYLIKKCWSREMHKDDVSDTTLFKKKKRGRRKERKKRVKKRSS